MKRAFDVSACALFLAFFWPVLLIIIVAIRLQSPGKAIFAQVRVGENGRLFICYKLRTMYSGTANLPTHQVRASAVTPLGEYLRRFQDRRASAALECADRRYEFGRSPALLAVPDRACRCEEAIGRSRSATRHNGVGTDQRRRYVGRKSARRDRCAICSHTKSAWRLQADLGHPARTGGRRRSGCPEQQVDEVVPINIPRLTKVSGRSHRPPSLALPPAASVPAPS